MNGDIKDLYQRTKWALILRGILSLLVGIAIIWRPMASVAAFALVIVFWSLFDGSVSIVRSIQLRGIIDHWWALLLAGIVSVGFGVAALYYFPGLSLTFAVLWTAYWLIVTGFVAVYISVQERRLGVSWGWTLTFGIVAIAGGVIALMNPQATLATLLGVIAGFSLISGVVLLIGAGRMQSFQRDVKRAVGSPARA
jgi:uncharacterized membrane protein HdeD (DUF308 family)